MTSTPEAPPSGTPASRRKGFPATRRQRWILSVAVVLALLVFVLPSVFLKAYRVPTGSMENTLLTGDYFVATRTLTGSPRRGDVVVLRHPEMPDRMFVKRVIALAGDTIQIRDKAVSVNGERVEEDYVQVSGFSRSPGVQETNISPSGAGNRDNYGLRHPVVVPPDACFVLGDKRDSSDDSRFSGFGLVPYDHLLGRALFIHFSRERSSEGSSVRWDRIGKRIS